MQARSHAASKICNLWRVFKTHCRSACIIIAFLLLYPEISWSNTDKPQYLMFHLFNGVVGTNGVFSEQLGAPQLMYFAREISSAFRPSGQVTSRQLGFDWGPIAPDLGAPQATLAIGQAFAVALATNE